MPTISDPIAQAAAERADHLPPAMEEDPGYEAYLLEMEREDERAKRHRGAYPLAWGQRLTGDLYFCGPCYRMGVEGGAHPYDLPPCDPIPHPDF